jgi:hypothetical protein
LDEEASVLLDLLSLIAEILKNNLLGVSKNYALLYSQHMPLSDHERRMLAEMEAAMEQDDPRLVSTLTGKARTRQAGKVVTGLLISLGGMAVLVGGLVAKLVPLGILGFAIALVGVVFILSNLMGAAGAGKSPAAPKAKKKSGLSKWTDGFEERWDRRNFER